MNDFAESRRQHEGESLDEAWSALAQLLYDAGPVLDEERLVRNVCQRLHRRRARRSLAIGLAAATLLLAAGVASWPHVSRQRQVAVAEDQHELRPRDVLSPDFTWRGDLENEIELTGWIMQSVEQDRNASDLAEWVREDLDQLEQELELSSL